MNNQQPQRIFEAKDWRKYSETLPGNVVAGIDEVGVESLAGPMTACLVIMPEDHGIPELPIDSKKLNPDTVQRIAEQIKEKALLILMFYVNGDQVDQWGVGKTQRKLWIKCADALRKKFPNTKIIIDGKDKIPKISNQQAIIGADNTVVSVSAASILAKAYTDQELAVLHDRYPKYNFKQHKGYGTEDHINRLKQHGLSPAHREQMTNKAIQKYKPKELHISTGEIKKYLEQALGFAAFGTTYIGEWNVKFVKEMASIPLKSITPKMAFKIKDTCKQGIKNAKRAKVDMKHIPPVKIVENTEEEEKNPKQMIEESIAFLRKDVDLTDEWGKQFIKSMIKAFNHQKQLSDKQMYHLKKQYQTVIRNAAKKGIKI